MTDLISNFFEKINLLDVFFLLVIAYNVIQCFLKGFSLSIISFMKWVLSAIVTIILVPKLQPLVSEYVRSEFINSLGLGMAIFIFTLFITILAGKTISKAVTWTGVGSIDKVISISEINTSLNNSNFDVVIVSEGYSYVDTLNDYIGDFLTENEQKIVQNGIYKYKLLFNRISITGTFTIMSEK